MTKDAVAIFKQLYEERKPGTREKWKSLWKQEDYTRRFLTTFRHGMGGCQPRNCFMLLEIVDGEESMIAYSSRQGS